MFPVFVVALLSLVAVESRAQSGAGGGKARPVSGPTPQFRTIDRETDVTDDESLEPTVSELETRARERELGDSEYPFHDQSREVAGDVECPEIEVTEYAGDVISYTRPIEINRHFQSRLVRFEEIVKQVATEIYGRAPDRIVQYGGHDCKTVGGEGETLSEHAFGHAIDVSGFNFDPVADGDAEDTERGRASEAFEVRVGEHWDASDGFGATHSDFLHQLADALERRGPFSTMLGPGYPGHEEIFHLDFGPEFFFRLQKK